MDSVITMELRSGGRLLQAFDVRRDVYEFLVSDAEHDLKLTFRQNMLTGTQARYQYLPLVLLRARIPPEEPWAATDRLIEEAKSRAREGTDSLLLGPRTDDRHKKNETTQAVKREVGAASSHY